MTIESSPVAPEVAPRPGGGMIERSPVAPEVALRACAAVAADVAAEGLVHGAGEAEHPFHVDPVPRVLAADEWARLARGVEQRVRALEAFAADAHGPQRAVRAGIVPREVIETSPYLEPGLPAPARYIGLAGPDVVRGADGSLVVLEDNVRTPTMLGFALALRRIVGRHVPGGPPAADATVRAALLRMLRSASAVEYPAIAVLGDGRRSALRWELEATAELLGVPLVEVGDRPGVDVLWRRTSDERLCEFDPWLSRSVHEGSLALMNAFGAGIADDKRVFAHVEALIRFFCDEEPLLRSVPTFLAADVIDRLDELVIKPRTGSGGYGVLIGPRARAEELTAARAAVEASPAEWIAQEPVALSTHPTVIDGRLEPRHVDLRPFACWDGERIVVLPVAFTRVALEAGNLIVNASQGGGGKDTWVG